MARTTTLKWKPWVDSQYPILLVAPSLHDYLPTYAGSPPHEDPMMPSPVRATLAE